MIWVDTNANGVVDPGEPGAPGITVNLYDNNNVLISTDVTDNNGNFSFPNLPPGDYYLIIVITDDFVFTPVFSTDPTMDNDSNADPNTGMRPIITVTPGEDANQWDSGIYLEAKFLKSTYTPSAGQDTPVGSCPAVF